MKDTMFATIVT